MKLKDLRDFFQTFLQRNDYFMLYCHILHRLVCFNVRSWCLNKTTATNNNFNNLNIKILTT